MPTFEPIRIVHSTRAMVTVINPENVTTERTETYVLTSSDDVKIEATVLTEFLRPKVSNCLGVTLVLGNFSQHEMETQQPFLDHYYCMQGSIIGKKLHDESKELTIRMSCGGLLVKYNGPQHCFQHVKDLAMDQRMCICFTEPL